MGSESVIPENARVQQVQSYWRADLPPSLLTARTISGEKIEGLEDNRVNFLSWLERVTLINCIVYLGIFLAVCSGGPNNSFLLIFCIKAYIEMLLSEQFVIQ